jgi:hypothetical protein
MLSASHNDTTKYIHQRLRDITDCSIKQLVGELEIVSRINVPTNGDIRLIHFLSSSLYPNGAAEQQVPISKADLDAHDPIDAFVLRKKIRLLTETVLYQVCREIAEMSGFGVEMIESQSLYSFLNKFLKLTLKPKRGKPARPRW